jgi:DNA mismatch repair protein MutS2
MFWDEETKRILHLKECMDVFQPLTPMGRQAWQKLRPFLHGEEEAWERSLREQEEWQRILPAGSKKREQALIHLARMPEIDSIVAELKKGQTLKLAEWFQMKSFLWHLFRLSDLLPPLSFLTDADRRDVHTLLHALNPGGSLVPSFWIDDAYDQMLAADRRILKKYERQREKRREQKATELEKRYSLRRNRLGEWVVERGSSMDQALMKEKDLIRVRETVYDAIYHLAEMEEQQALHRIEALTRRVEALELAVLKRLTDFFVSYAPKLDAWEDLVARFDLQLARIRAAETWRGKKPEYAPDRIEIQGGFHPWIARMLEKEGKKCTPIDCVLRQGATVIIGANMGGKTVALKTIGMIALLSQCGFFVPAASCKLPLFSWVRGIIGDQQNTGEGLSSFAAEIERLCKCMELGDGGLLLLDEIGRGTNPIEGAALAQAITRHFTKRPLWSVHVTHYQEVLEVEGISGYRVAGLSHERAQGDLLRTEFRRAVIKGMDYRLLPLKPGESVPHEALWIAECLGLDSGIIKDAKIRLREEESAGGGKIEIGPCSNRQGEASGSSDRFKR